MRAESDSTMVWAWATFALTPSTSSVAWPMSPSPMLSRSSTGFSVRNRKPRMRDDSSASSPRSRIGRPSVSAGRIRSRTTSSRSFASRSAGVPWRPLVRSFSTRFSTTDRSASVNSSSSRSMSRQASTLPSGWATAGSSNARTTWSSASALRRRASWSAGMSAAGLPSGAAGGAGRST